MLHKLEGQVLGSRRPAHRHQRAAGRGVERLVCLVEGFRDRAECGIAAAEVVASAHRTARSFIADRSPTGTNLPASFEAAREAKVSLKIIGGTEEEWQTVGEKLDLNGIEWLPHVPLNELPEVLAGARAGLIPTNPDAPSGEFSCPLKLFDYARCGLPVLSHGAAFPAKPRCRPVVHAGSKSRPRRVGGGAAKFSP